MWSATKARSVSTADRPLLRWRSSWQSWSRNGEVSANTISSLEGKYANSVPLETSAASAISATVVCW